MEKLIIVSCDGHVGAPVAEYGQYLEPAFRDWMPQIIEEERNFLQMQSMFNLHTPERLAVVDYRGVIQSGGLSSGWDIDRRLKELDGEGIAAEIVYPGTAEATAPFFYQLNRPYPDDVRMAGLRAYHRWLIDHMLVPGKGRLIGTADPGPSTNWDETLEELRFCAINGFRTVFLPGFVSNPALPPLVDAHYERFWAACSDMNLVLTIHAGWGTKQGDFSSLVDEFGRLQTMLAEQGEETLEFGEGLRGVMALMDGDNPDSIFNLDLGPRRAVWQLIFSGVFDRYPNLKVVVSECRADWVPALKTHLDQRFLSAAKRPNLKRKPSEYFGENIFIAPSSPRRAEVERRHEIGLKNFLFASDFPHPEGTWPNTLAWLQAVFFDTPESDLRAILGETAIDVYGLDREMLAGVAGKIGFKPNEIIGDHAVDERVIADFEMRSQFSQTSPQYEDILDDRIDSDLIATA